MPPKSDLLLVLKTPDTALGLLPQPSGEPINACTNGRQGYAVKVAASASEALEAMLAEPVPIMVCDIKMPGHDGLWLAQRVRARWPKTAIIIATGAHAHDLAAVVASRKLGAVDYIMKPFEREMLRQALRRAADAFDGCKNT